MHGLVVVLLCLPGKLLESWPFSDAAVRIDILDAVLPGLLERGAGQGLAAGTDMVVSGRLAQGATETFSGAFGTM